MKEALRLALEALEMFCEHGAILRPIETRDAIKAALEAKDEPVAWVCEGFSSDEKHAIDYWQGDVDDLPIGTQLYTTPPQRKPLTDEEINTLDYSGTRIEFVRAIEAKLKEKNT